MFSFGHCPNVRWGASDARIRNGHIPVFFSGSSLTLTFKSNDDVIIQDKISTRRLTNIEVLSKRGGLPDDSSDCSVES